MFDIISFGSLLVTDSRTDTPTLIEVDNILSIFRRKDDSRVILRDGNMLSCKEDLSYVSIPV